MQIAGNHIHATTRFATHQYPGIVFGDAFDLFTQALHDGAFTNGLDDSMGDTTQTLIFAFKPIAFQRMLDGQE